MRNRVFLFFRQVGISLFVALRDEERIVPEASVSRGSLGDEAVALTDDDMLFACGVNESNCRNKCRVAIGYTREVFHQKRIIRRSITRLARIACTMHARGSVEKVHTKTRIVC